MSSSLQAGTNYIIYISPLSTNLFIQLRERRDGRRHPDLCDDALLCLADHAHHTNGDKARLVARKAGDVETLFIQGGKLEVVVAR